MASGYGKRVRGCGLVLLTMLCTALANCTLLSDFDIHACTTDTECTPFADSVRHCDGARCVDGCRDNHHCLSVAPGYPICQHSGGQCIGLTSERGDCSVLTGYSDGTMGALTAEDMIVLGAFAPRVRSSAWLSLELAVNEINETGGLANRPLLLGVCSDSPGAQPAAIDYLLTQLKARAILASLDEQALRITASLASIDPDVVLLSPHGYFSQPTSNGDPALAVWYLGPPYESVASTYSLMVQSMASSSRARSAPSTIKIATVTGPAEEDVRLAVQVHDSLQLNGVDATRLELEDRLHPFTITDDPDQRERLIPELIAYEPDIILWFAGGTFQDAERDEQTSLIPLLEEGAAETAYAPVYLLGPRNVEDSTLESIARASLPYRSRLIGLRADRPYDAAVKESVLARFRAAFPLAMAGPLRFYYPAYSTYDALYYLAYASTWSALHGNPGAASGLMRITEPSTEEIVLGPDPTSRARVLELVQGQSPLNLAGTSGPADFDRARRARPAAVRAYCWTENAGLDDLAEVDVGAGTLRWLPTNCSTGLLGGVD